MQNLDDLRNQLEELEIRYKVEELTAEQYLASRQELVDLIKTAESKLNEQPVFDTQNAVEMEVIKPQKTEESAVQNIADLQQKKEQLKAKISTIERELDIKKQEQNKNFATSGELAYTIFCDIPIPNSLKDNFDHIKFVDKQLNDANQQIKAIKAQLPTGGFMSKLKDKAVATAKTTKLDYDIHNLNRNKRQLIFELGKTLLDCQNKGITIHEELRRICEKMGELNIQIHSQESELISLRKSGDEVKKIIDGIKARN